MTVPGSNSSLLSGFVLGSPEFNSSTVMCIVVAQLVNLSAIQIVNSLHSTVQIFVYLFTVMI